MARMLEDNHTDVMEFLRAQTQLKSRYTVFDASGRLPFDIVFGLRRRSDSDPRDISFQVTKSFLDVPYALAHGLLRLHELRRSDKSPNEHVEVDLSRLRDAIAGDEQPLEYIILPSKSNRTAERGQMGFTEYRYRIDPGSPLASLFEPGKKYSIGLADRDLGTHRWIGSDQVRHSNTNTTPSSLTDSAVETCKLISNPRGGFAVFTVVRNLVWPPNIKTRMHLPSRQTDRTSGSDEPDHAVMWVTVTNTGSESLSIQTRGQQRFLSPWGPFQPESDDGLNAGKRPCILDSSRALSNLQVIDLTTGSTVRDSRKSGVCGLTVGRPDTRPRMEDLVSLQPGIALSRDIRLDALLGGFNDGRYLIHLKPKGCWWHSGEIESEPGDGGRVPKSLMTAMKTPLVLESDDAVAVDVSDGRVSPQSLGRTLSEDTEKEQSRLPLHV